MFENHCNVLLLDYTDFKLHQILRTSELIFLVSASCTIWSLKSKFSFWPLITWISILCSCWEIVVLIFTLTITIHLSARLTLQVASHQKILISLVVNNPYMVPSLMDHLKLFNCEINYSTSQNKWTIFELVCIHVIPFWLDADQVELIISHILAFPYLHALLLASHSLQIVKYLNTSSR